ncbi:MAG: TSUP family transporter [Oscillospiraceae bacterium]
MNFAVIAIVSFLTGIMASLGLGGGMILIIYLTIFAGVGQIQALGINLFFFIPIALLSLFFHNKNHLINWKTVIRIIIPGIISVILFSLLANHIDNSILQKLFGGFVILGGIKEIFSKSDQ